MNCNFNNDSMFELPFELTEEDKDNIMFFVSKRNVANEALGDEVVRGYDFKTDEELMGYFSACFDILKESHFLNYTWEKNFRERNNYYGDLFILEGKCYTHNEEDLNGIIL